MGELAGRAYNRASADRKVRPPLCTLCCMYVVVSISGCWLRARVCNWRRLRVPRDTLHRRSRLKAHSSSIARRELRAGASRGIARLLLTYLPHPERRIAQCQRSFAATRGPPFLRGRVVSTRSHAHFCVSKCSMIVHAAEPETCSDFAPPPCSLQVLRLVCPAHRRPQWQSSTGICHPPFQCGHDRAAPNPGPHFCAASPWSAGSQMG